ncbi:MAG: HXXEE domain-containing protein [Myxococcaceae bacterium]
MQLESILWLLPVFFMLHDFEEIIMIKPWFTRHEDTLRTRLPAAAGRLLPHFQRLSTSAFALAVAEEFMLLSAVTVLVVEHGWYELWAGVLLVLLLHFVMHQGQAIFFRGYVPVVLTTVPGTVFGVWALAALSSRGLLDWGRVALWTGVSAVLVVVNGALIHWMAALFQRWLDRAFAAPAARQDA